MIRRPPRSTQSRSSAASDVYKRQLLILAILASQENLNFFGFILANNDISKRFALINFSEYLSEKISRRLILARAMIEKKNG